MRCSDLISADRLNGVSRIVDNREYLVGNFQIDYPIESDGLRLRFFADNILEFRNYLSKKNIPYLYVQLPNKLSPEETNLPKYINNTQNHIATEFLQHLEERGVANFDMRQCFIENNLKFEEMFFKTDIHWTPETAFQVTPIICELIGMVTKTEFEQSFFDINNYNTKTHERMFHGVYGNRSQSYIFPGLSDFTIILPKFETNFIFECKNLNYRRIGRAEETLLLKSQFSWDRTPRFKNVYVTYNLAYGDYTIIKNTMAYNDKKILILNDSFSNALAGFLAHHFSELHFIELRPNMKGVQNYKKKELFEIIDKVNPDIVLQMYFPNSVTEYASFFDINPTY